MNMWKQWNVLKIYQLTRKARVMMEGFLIQIILKRKSSWSPNIGTTCAYSAPKFSTSFLLLMLLVASLGVLEIWYNNDDDVIMIVITTSASYTMEGRILWMPFTTLTESGLEMIFCLTSGNSSFSRDKKSGCSRLMININILKGHWNVWWLNHSQSQTADFWFCQFSGIMGHGTALSRLWILVLSFLLGYHLQLFSERDVIVFIVRYLFVKAAENCMMAMAVWLYISSHQVWFWQL